MCVCVCSNIGSSPANDSPDPPSPRTDPAVQLAVEAKELVEGVTTVTSDEKGTEYTPEYSDINTNLQLEELNWYVNT